AGRPPPPARRGTAVRRAQLRDVPSRRHWRPAWSGRHPEPGGGRRGLTRLREHGGLLGDVRGTDHPEVRRRLVREELAAPAVPVERTVQQEHLPEAVRLRLTGERGAKTGDRREVVTPQMRGDGVVELLRLRRVAILSLRVV